MTPVELKAHGQTLNLTPMGLEVTAANAFVALVQRSRKRYLPFGDIEVLAFVRGDPSKNHRIRIADDGGPIDIFFRPSQQDALVALWRELAFRCPGALDARSDSPLPSRRRSGAAAYMSESAPPSPMEYGVSHQGAERLVAAWMCYLGARDAAVTQFSGDGGIDVVSTRYLAQVKNYAGAVPISSIRELHGVAVADGRLGLFFTSGHYPASAIQFAERVGMALFIYGAEEGVLRGANPLAQEYMSTGL